MINDVMLNKVKEIMGDGRELLFLQGQLRNITKHVKDEDKSVYYLADIRVPRNLSADVYAVSFSVYHVCFSSDLVKHAKLDDLTMKEFKDNEVLLSLTSMCSLNTKRGEAGQIFKYNNVKYFVDDVMLVSKIAKPSSVGNKVVNI